MEFLKRYNKMMLYAIILSLLAASISFYKQLNYQYYKELNMLHNQLKEEALLVDNILKTAVDAVAAIKLQAQLYSRVNLNTTPESRLFEMLEDINSGKYFSLDGVRHPYNSDIVGKMLGTGSLDKLSSYDKLEVKMALSLNPTFLSIKENSPSIETVYYFSQKGFVNIYPNFELNDISTIDSLVKYASEKVKSHTKPYEWRFYDRSLINGKAAVSFTSAVSFDKGTAGIAGADLKLDFVRDFMNKFKFTYGDVYLIDSTNNVLVYPETKETFFKDNSIDTVMSSKYSPSILERLKDLSNTKPLEFNFKGRYIFAYQNLNYAPFKILYISNTRYLLFPLILNTLIAFVPILFGFIFVLIVSKQTVRKDFIAPIHRLLEYFRQESTHPPAPIPDLPNVWNDYLDTIYDIFQKYNKRFKELETKNLSLQKADKLKDEFLANITSEFHTPLKTITDHCNSLINGLGGELNPIQKQNINTIVENARHLTSLSVNILDYSKIKLLGLRIQTRPINLKNVLIKVKDYSRYIIGQNPVKIVDEIDENIPKVEADEERLYQIIINIIEQIMQHIEEGEIKINAEEEGEQIRIIISHSGASIDQESAEEITLSFEEHDPDKYEYNVTALTFSLIGKLVDLHGGATAFENVLKERFAFSFTIPISKIKEEPLISETAESKTETDTAKEEQLVVSKDNEDVKFVIRETPFKFTISSEKTVALNILVAEDDIFSSRLIPDILRRRGHNVTLLNNGKDALKTLEKQNFDMLIIDVKLPEIDGLRAARIIRNSSLRPDLPIIAVGCFGMKNEKERCLKAGIDYYISMPIKARELVEIVYNVLKINRSPDSIDVRYQEPDYGEENFSYTFSLNDIIDKKEAFLWVDFNKELLEDMLQVFVEHIPALIERLGKEIDSSDIDLIIEDAHMLKRAAIIIGAGLIRDGAQKLITAAETSEINMLKMLFQMIEFEITRIVSSLKPEGE
ncbi:membrane protein containing Signal transduction response regulator, receiver region domain protein [Candidatus Magnetoovum chiemensis]|nr:membrane protein containing Signal transduction response regulator, receiver region domain protein [Candidatus Magnetoovum chiemensis]